MAIIDLSCFAVDSYSFAGRVFNASNRLRTAMNYSLSGDCNCPVNTVYIKSIKPIACDYLLR